MKRAITTILALFFLFAVATSQNAKPSKEAIRDFSISFYYKYKFEKNQSLQAYAYITGNRLGYSLVDIQVAVEKMETDVRFREELLKVMGDLYKTDVDFFTLNLISIGMKATNAKELASYVYQKHEQGSGVTVEPTKIIELKDSNKEHGKTNIPKAIFAPPTQKKSEYNRLFTGTKIFCDPENIWKYEVTVIGDSVILKLFPGSANSHHKNKSKPVETVKGIIVNGNIITKDSPEYLTNRFRYKNGILYETNNEGEYNDYPICN